MPSNLTAADETHDGSDEPVGIVGAGPMAVEYAKAATHLGIPYRVYGRGADSAATFQAATGVRPGTGPLAHQLSTSPIRTAIVAVGIPDLPGVAAELIDNGCKRLLLEKPGALNRIELETLADRASRSRDVEIFVAYNRRFYPGVQRAKEIIGDDGGVTSITFNFTEAAWRVDKLQKNSRVKENWLFANSSHVIDLAFFLAGRPASLNAMSQGGLSWHPGGSQFVGHGQLEGGGVFSYHADWEAPGSWSIEAMTKNHRFIFRPLESLRIQSVGSFDIQDIDFGVNSNSMTPKTGLCEMIQRLLENRNDKDLVTLGDQIESFKLYESVLSGTDIRKP
ncbi:hypothetical protein [Fodinicurvata sp. EGI_FJ10296]|uniref:Gfo/Idh/MocA family protein n=1 Tax=Fodinicurvata sp. EGI_FJ10296 TaxID=3231908 RepID=UPI003456C86A